jgi:hypothetical protein
MYIELTSLPARAAYRPNRCMAILLLMKRIDRPTSLTSPQDALPAGNIVIFGGILCHIVAFLVRLWYPGRYGM